MMAKIAAAGFLVTGIWNAIVFLDLVRNTRLGGTRKAPRTAREWAHLLFLPFSCGFMLLEPIRAMHPLLPSSRKGVSLSKLPSMYGSRTKSDGGTIHTRYDSRYHHWWGYKKRHPAGRNCGRTFSLKRVCFGHYEKTRKKKNQSLLSLPPETGRHV